MFIDSNTDWIPFQLKQKHTISNRNGRMQLSGNGGRVSSANKRIEGNSSCNSFYPSSIRAEMGRVIDFRQPDEQ